MRKGRLFTTSMATALLLATLTSPVAGAKTHEEIERFYQSDINSPTTTNHQTTRTLAPTQQSNRVANSDTVQQLETKLANSSSIYDSASVLNQASMIQQAVAVQQGMYTDSFVSDVDSVRRSALEKVFGISLTDIEMWDNREGQDTPMGGQYTTVKQMKDLAMYSVNANRQELIKYGIVEKNWQPYRWFYAMTNPSYFELVDGKLEYNKNYYANSADTYLTQLLRDYNEEVDATKKEELKKIFDSELKSTIESYNKAPGYAVYSSLLHYQLNGNSNYTITPADKDYSNSKWNNQKVRLGESLDGTNPYKDIIKGLQNGTLVGNISSGYQKANADSTQPTTTETKTDDNLNKEINKALDKATASLKTEPNAIANVEENKIMDVKPVKKETEKQPSLFDRIILKVKQVANLD